MIKLSELQETVWVEKYRPKKIEDMVLPDQYRKNFTTLIRNNDMNNLLLYGAPGGGKSALARIICSKNGVIQNKDFNVLSVNGSSKKSRGIGFIDDVIEPFLKVPPLKDKYKIVFIDESDNLTPDSFKSLRGIIEKFLTSYGRFIMTCNFFSKIPDPIISRFDSYHFKQLPKENVFEFCSEILKKENITYESDDLKYIINSFYPDVRRIVNRLERCSKESIGQNKLIVDRNKVLSVEKKILSECLELIDASANNEKHKTEKLMNEILKGLAETPELSYSDLYVKLYMNNKVIPPAKIEINKYANEHQSCLEPLLNFSSMLYEVIDAFDLYRETKIKAVGK